jgi:hypothetical protein
VLCLNQESTQVHGGFLMEKIDLTLLKNLMCEKMLIVALYKAHARNAIFISLWYALHWV